MDMEEYPYDPRKLSGLTFTDGLKFGLGFFTAGLLFTIIVAVGTSIIVGLGTRSAVERLSTESTGRRPREVTEQEERYVAAMKSDLERLARTQEAYFRQHGQYAGNIRLLNFSASEEVRIILQVPDQSGWLAKALHPRTRQVCAIYFGSPRYSPSPARQEGVVACQSP